MSNYPLPNPHRNINNRDTVKNNSIQNPLLYTILIRKGVRLPNPLIVFHMKLNGLSKPFNTLTLHI